MKNQNVYELATQQIVELLSQNINPWAKPWVTRQLLNQKNLNSGRAYTGINALILSLQDKPLDYWLTFKQADDLGFKIKHGEKSTLIIGWFKTSFKNKDADPDDENDSRSGLACRYYRVFNLSQCDNVPDSLLKKAQRPEVATFSEDKNELAEKIIIDTLANIKFGSEIACYRPRLDEISMPDRNRFEKQNEFYSTMFHELGHWTGHESRLNRSELAKANLFNSKNYSKEELCAEMTSVFVCSSLGISGESALRNSAAYLQSWLKFLKGDSKAFVIACQQAQKASDFILKTKKEVSK